MVKCECRCIIRFNFFSHKSGNWTWLQVDAILTLVVAAASHWQRHQFHIKSPLSPNDKTYAKAIFSRLSLGTEWLFSEYYHHTFLSLGGGAKQLGRHLPSPLGSRVTELTLLFATFALHVPKHSARQIIGNGFSWNDSLQISHVCPGCKNCFNFLPVSVNLPPLSTSTTRKI